MRSPLCYIWYPPQKKRAHLSPKDPVKIKQFFLLHHKLLESRYLHFFFCHPMMAIETTAKKIMNPACISKAVWKVESAHHKRNTWSNLDFKGFFFFFSWKTPYIGRKWPVGRLWSGWSKYRCSVVCGFNLSSFGQIEPILVMFEVCLSRSAGCLKSRYPLKANIGKSADICYPTWHGNRYFFFFVFATVCYRIILDAYQLWAFCDT